MRITTDAKAGQWIKATNTYEKIMAAAATKAMRQAGKGAVLKGRERITAAGFSQKFARTLQALNKPPTGYVLNPKVYIHTTINYADVFEKGATIHAEGGHYLWLPQPNVPAIKGRPHMTPKQYLQNVGSLVLMWRPGKAPMLGAPVKGKVQPGRRITRGRLAKSATASRRETQLVIMFVGVKSITIPKKFDVTNAIEDAFEPLNNFYQQLAEPYDGRK